MNRSELISQISENMASFKRVLVTSHAIKCKIPMPTPAQIGILALIAQGGPHNLKDLARQLHMSSSAATQLVDGLDADKMLKRVEDSSDRRRVLLTLTATGKHCLSKAKACHVTAFTKLFAPLSEEELMEWKRLQEKILKQTT